MGDTVMNRIQELEERISVLRTEMRNLTGRDRQTQQRMINEIADKIARLRREHEDELSSVSWDAHDIDDGTKDIVAKYSSRGTPGAMPRIPRGLPAMSDKRCD